MRRRIFWSLCGAGVFSILLAAVFMLGSFYNFYTQQVETELQRECALIASYLEERPLFETVQTYLESEQVVSDVRLTLIEPDGRVVYDSDMDPNRLANHMDRPEIKAAQQAGSGEAVRYSQSARTNTYYYAERLTTGEILRLSRQAGSIRQIFYSIIPIILGIMTILFVLCAMAASWLTRRLIAPIARISSSLDDEDSWDYYEELTPFMQKISAQQKEIQDQLEEQKRLENIRREFTSNVSHELKTPLTSISGYAEIIGNGMAAPQDIGEFSFKIKKEASRLLTLIDDIIRLSRIETEQERKGGKEAVNLYKICRSVQKTLQYAADERNVDLRIFGNPGLTLTANPIMLEEMLFNLCDNGVKYNQAGSYVYISFTESEGGVAIAVRDTGIGISQEHHQRIFERFYRVDKSRSKHIGGTGLGLSIVKHIVEFHEGWLKLESAPGEGTTVTVWLPEAARSMNNRKHSTAKR